MSRPRTLLLVLASLIAFVSQATIAAEGSGLVAEWNFDEGQGDIAHDSSGNGNDLRLLGAVWSKSSNGSALQLDGLGGRAECALSDYLQVKNAFTVEAWIKPLSRPWAEPNIFGATNGDYRIGYSNRGTCWWYVSTQGNEAGGKLVLGKWNHIVGAYEGEDRVFWINGQLAGKVKSRPPKRAKGKFVIGSENTPFFHGEIDHLRIYNRALSFEEALAHYRSEAPGFGIDPTWFKRVKVQPYYYFDRGEMTLDIDYSAMMPLRGVGKVDVALLREKDAVQTCEVDKLPNWGSTQVSFPLKSLEPGKYSVRVQMTDGETSLPVETIEFEYPPAPPALPSPIQHAVGPLPVAAAPVPYSVELSKSGGFRLKIKDATYPFLSRISWPNGGFNQLSADDSAPTDCEKSWKVETRSASNEHQVDASGEFYTLHRQIEIFPTHVRVNDTYVNNTDQDLGLLVYNELPLKAGQLLSSRLCGYEGGGRCVDVLSPHYGGASIFLRDQNTGIGMLPMDDAYVIQSLLYIEKNIAGMATERLALAPKASHTLRWDIYPTGSGDYYDFITTFRHEEDRIGTVEGGLSFVSYGPNNRRQVPDENFVKTRGVNVAMLHGLTRIADDAGISAQGFEFIDFPKERAMLRAQAQAIHSKFPGMKVVFHIAHTLYATNDPERYADSKLTAPNGVQHASGGLLDFSQERIDQKWAYYVYYPTPGNSFHDAMMKSVDVMMDEMGFDGAFVDGFLLGYGGRWTYDRWDGVSADIDLKTKTITRKIGSVLLLMQPSMVQYARKIHDKNGIVIANGSVMTPTITKEKYMVYDAECQAGPESHLAPNAMSLALGPFTNEKEVYLDVLDKLSWGVLYMFYNDRIPLTHLSLAAKEFPMTFEEIRAGCVRGNQRIVTMNQGVYGWPSDHSLHRIFKFDSRGAPAENAFVSTSDSDGVRTELNFAQDESAVIERIPARVTSAGPVNVLVKEYEPGKLSLLANGQGQATLTVFVGTSYPDRREGVFTNGGVSRLDVGVGDAYAVTINGTTNTLQEQDGVLSVPLKLDGQSDVVILRSQREGKE